MYKYTTMRATVANSRTTLLPHVTGPPMMWERVSSGNDDLRLRGMPSCSLVLYVLHHEVRESISVYLQTDNKLV